MGRGQPVSRPATVVQVDRFYRIPHREIAAPHANQLLDSLEPILRELHPNSRFGDDSNDQWVLVGMHVAVKESDDWTWATIWWHDAPTQYPVEQRAPSPSLDNTVWQNYIIDATLGPEKFEVDARPVFNPYLEAAHTGGVLSNCFSCHQLAVRTGGFTAEDVPVRVRRRFSGPHNRFHNNVRLDYVWSLGRR